MKKTTLILLFIFFVAANLRSQESYIKNRWNIKLGYSRYEQSEHVLLDDKVNNFRLETNYGINNYIEIGGWLGYGFCSEWTVNYWDEFYGGSCSSYKNASALLYGINTNFHLLPFLIKKGNFRFDIYTSAKLGGSYIFSDPGNYPTRGAHIEYGLLGGISFYFAKHMGFFAEYGISNVSNFKYGLSFKF